MYVPRRLPLIRLLPNAAGAELSVNGRLLYIVAELSPIEGTALATALRNLAAHVENVTCDGRQAGEVLAEADVSIEVHGDEPSNVERTLSSFSSRHS